MLYAYFDESGHPSDSKVVSVAAVVSTIRKWHVFDEKWRKILRRYKVPNGLHMTDYENRKGDFKGWPKKDQKAIDFIAELAAVLKNNIRYGCVYSLNMEDWNEVMRDRFTDPFERKRSSFIVLFQTCLESILITKSLPQGQKIACMFEENKFLTGAAPSHFAGWKKGQGVEEKFGSFAFGKKYEYPGLQGSDMLAYEGAKWLINKGERPERKLHKVLKQCNKIEFKYLDESGLLDYLQELPNQQALMFS